MLLCFKDGVKTQVVSIRNILSYHHKLMSDIRSILKSLAKVIKSMMDITIKSVKSGLRYLMCLSDVSVQHQSGHSSISKAGIK